MVTGVIEIGIIAKGRRVLDRPVAKAIHRVLLAARERTVEPSIELVYVIPGELGKADFDGFDLSHRNDRTRRPIVFIDVPRDIADTTTGEPLSDVIELARDALAFARERLRTRSNGLDFDAAQRELSEIQEGLLPEGLVKDHTSARAGGRRASHRSQEDTAHSVEIALRVVDDNALDAAYALEERLDSELTNAGAGYVDGNEIGQGEYRIFTYGPSWTRLRDVVSGIVSEAWKGQETLVVSSTQHGEQDRLIL
jgi:hypothetical protein